MKPLTRAEEQVMQAVWNLGQGFLKDILDQLPQPRPHSNTIATILKILVEKGFIEYEARGRNNLYKPLVNKAEYGKRSLHQLIKNYFEGSPLKLVSQFLNDNKISSEELETLLQQIRNAKINKQENKQ
jgi:BlaI family penicillinase repressor